MSAVSALAPTSEQTVKATAPATVDRRALDPRELREHIRVAHALPRRRAEWIARQCYRDPRTAVAYLPGGWAETLHPTVTTYVRRVPRMVGTGETGRLDRAGVTAQ